MLQSFRSHVSLGIISSSSQQPLRQRWKSQDYENDAMKEQYWKVGIDRFNFHELVSLQTRHTDFSEVTIHTAKCEICSNHNKAILHYCWDCGWPIYTIRLVEMYITEIVAIGAVKHRRLQRGKQPDKGYRPENSRSSARVILGIWPHARPSASWPFKVPRSQLEIAAEQGYRWAIRKEKSILNLRTFSLVRH